MQHFWIQTIVIAGALVAASCRPNHEPLEKLKKQIASLQAENQMLTKKKLTVAELEQTIKELKSKNKLVEAEIRLKDKLATGSSTIWVSHITTDLASEAEREASNSIFPQLSQYLVGIRVTSVYTDNNIKATLISSGSGVIINPEGYIITNSHCIPSDCENSIKIVFIAEDGSGCRTYSAEFIERDEDQDLALLKIPPKAKKWPGETFRPIKFGQSDTLKSCTNSREENREMLYMLGENVQHPKKGLNQLHYTGSVGYCIGSVVNYDAQEIFLLCSYSSISGTSGGPVVNKKLELVAINKGTCSSDSVIYAIAIASNEIKKFVEKYIPNFDSL